MSSSAPSQQDLKQRGNTHFQNDDFEKAIDFYTQAINLDPAGDPTVPILSNRSLCYFNLDKYKEAYEDAGCCCGLKPDWAKGFARRGFAAMKLEEYEIALESFDEYLKLNNDNDEMDVRRDRNFMNKLMTAKRKRQEEKQRSLERIEKDLQNISDPDARHAEACALFYRGYEHFPESRDRMRVAAKYCRLDTPVEVRDPEEEDIDDTFKLVSGFKKSDIDACWADIRTCTLSRDDQTYHCSTLIHQTLYKILVNNLDLSSADCLLCFDYFCDLVEDAEEDYSPLAAEGDNDSKLEMKKREILMESMTTDCWTVGRTAMWRIDRGPVALVGEGKFFLDLTLTLLLRGKHLIFGKKTQMTDKEFATRLFREFIYQNVFQCRKISHAGCRDVVNACRALLDAKADVNGIIPNSGLPQLATLHLAIESGKNLAAPLAELFVRHEADLNYVSQDGGSTTLLDIALERGQGEIAEVLFARGARLQFKEPPNWTIEWGQDICSHLPDPSLVKPHCINFCGFFSVATTRVLFDMMTKQDLSFYGAIHWCDMESDTYTEEFATPLANSIGSWSSSSAAVELIVKLKPSLVFAPVFRQGKKQVIIIDNLVYLAEKTSVKRSRKDDIVYFKEVAKILIVQGGFDFKTAYREHEMKTGKSNYPFVDMQELTDREKNLQEYLWQLVGERRVKVEE